MAQIGTASTYAEREKRFNDAVSLSKPDRVPLVSFTVLFFTKYAGLTHKEALYDYEKMAAAVLKSMQKLNWDMAPLYLSYFPGRVMELMGLKAFNWPGYNLGDNVGYQYIEKEYMLADEYDEFLNDEGNYVIHKLMPRMASTFQPLAFLPALSSFASGYVFATTVPLFLSMPGFAEMMNKLVQTGQEMGRRNAVHARLARELAQLGYPTLCGGAVTQTAFDWVCSLLRGLKGTMTDIYRQPDKLKAAIEKLIPQTIGSAIASARMTGNPRVFIPLWRGAADFMSDKQFEEFYWPSLKQLVLALIANGLTPMPWFEGNYTPRLKYLAELPPGKVAGHFDRIDKQQYKSILGKTMCFWGDVPPQILVTGTPTQVRDYVKKLIDFLGDTNGLIVDGGVEGVPADSKPENVEAMTEAVFEYGKL